MRYAYCILVLCLAPVVTYSASVDVNSVKHDQEENHEITFDSKKLFDKKTLKMLKQEVSEKREVLGSIFSDIATELLGDKVKTADSHVEGRSDKKKSSKLSPLAIALITKAIVVGTILVTGLKLFAAKIFLDVTLVVGLGLVYALWNFLSGSSSKVPSAYNFANYRPFSATTGWTSNALGTNNWADSTGTFSRSLNVEKSQVDPSATAHEMAYAAQIPKGQL